MRGIHQGYFEAGSDIVETNTFGGTRLKLKEYGIGDRTRELNEKGVRLARAAAPPERFVAGSIGPTSCVPAEFGVGDNVATDDEYYESFREQAEALAEGGVDLFAVETMMFPQEAAAAIRACKAVADLPVMATMFFQYEELHDRDRTMWGESPAEVAKGLLAAGADIVGMNCGRGPRPRHRHHPRDARGDRRAPRSRTRTRVCPSPRATAWSTSWDRRRWLASIRPSSTPAATSSGPAAARIPSTSAASPRSCAPERSSAALDDETPRVLSDIALDIDPAEVLRFQGYKAGAAPPGPDVVALFDEALALGRRLMSPRVVVRWLPRHERGVMMRWRSPAKRSMCRASAARWGPIEFAAVAVCTVGEAVEQRVRGLWEARELPLAAMLDSVGSGATESLAEYVNDVLCQEGLASGLRVTNRISPGYGPWDVAEQQTLFRLCPGVSIGVTLNDDVLHDTRQEHLVPGRVPARTLASTTISASARVAGWQPAPTGGLHSAGALGWGASKGPPAPGVGAPRGASGSAVWASTGLRRPARTIW